MARYVTSLRSDAKLAHIGYPVKTCGLIFPGLHRVSDEMPADRRICPECLSNATGYGWITEDEAAAMQQVGAQTRFHGDLGWASIEQVANGASYHYARLAFALLVVGTEAFAAMLSAAGAFTPMPAIMSAAVKI